MQDSQTSWLQTCQDLSCDKFVVWHVQLTLACWIVKSALQTWHPHLLIISAWYYLPQIKYFIPSCLHRLYSISHSRETHKPFILNGSCRPTNHHEIFDQVLPYTCSTTLTSTIFHQVVWQISLTIFLMFICMCKSILY